MSITAEKALEFANKLADGDVGELAFVVSNRTGCSCCRDENFYSGPYRTEEEANEVIETRKKHPTLGSQYASNGLYGVERCHVLELTDDVLIVDGNITREGWGQYQIDLGYKP